MLINSLFIINSTGDIFMEKHWKSVVNKSICDYFFEAQSKASTPDDVPPVISTPHYYLIPVYRNSLYMVAVIQNEVPPLFVIEFIHRIMDIFKDYFGECSESRIKENYVVVYELLEEVLDNGFPLATEANILKELIRPPGLIGSVVRAIKDESHLLLPDSSLYFIRVLIKMFLKDIILLKVSKTLPTGQLSNVPWRRTGVKYMNNEVYFDMIEEIDCIIDKQGTTVYSEIKGNVQCNCQLSGMPDLTMSFMNHRVMEDVSFHPCVRFKRWEAEHVVSFIPPDGAFTLFSYNTGSQSQVPQPVYVQPNFHFSAGGGKMEVRVGAKQLSGKQVEDLHLTIPFNKSVTAVNYTATLGFARYDPAERVLKWKIGKLDPAKSYVISGSVQASSDFSDSHPAISVNFKVPSYAASGIKVTRLEIYSEKYKAFKGIKYLTKAGKYQVRV